MLAVFEDGELGYSLVFVVADLELGEQLETVEGMLASLAPTP